MRVIQLLTILATLASSTPLFAQNYCKSWKVPTVTGNLGTRGLDETSGIVASRRQKDVLWLHNDSGDTPRIFALTNEGKYLGQWTLEGVDPEDWEDIAWGPCSDGISACLWIADTGNNTLLRETLRIYRVREPDIDTEKPPAKHVIEDVDVIEFRYPDRERFDAEALMVASDGTFWIVSKGATEAHLFRGKVPDAKGASIILQKVGTRDGLRLVTGGDMAADETRFVLRGYDWAMVFPIENGKTPADVFEDDTVAVPLAVEPQGEAIAYSADGRALLATSEERHQPIFRYECEAFANEEEIQSIRPATETKSTYPESRSTSTKWLGCRSVRTRVSGAWALAFFIALICARRWHF